MCRESFKAGLCALGCAVNITVLLYVQRPFDQTQKIINSLDVRQSKSSTESRTHRVKGTISPLEVTFSKQ